jgi:hypothetical protein
MEEKYLRENIFKWKKNLEDKISSSDVRILMWIH